MSVIHESSAIETILQQIDTVLFRAGKYGGKAFGDFVNNVIVPRLEDPTANILFDNVDVANVDLWFTTEKNATDFLKHMRLKSPNRNVDVVFDEATKELFPTRSNKRYGHSAKQYSMSNLVYVNIFISEEFPVEDLDINCLTYTCIKDYSNNPNRLSDSERRNSMNSTGKKIVTKELKAEKGFQKEQLVKAIRNKEATLFEDDSKKIGGTKDLDRLILKGWTIKYREILINLETISWLEIALPEYVRNQQLIESKK